MELLNILKECVKNNNNEKLLEYIENSFIVDIANQIEDFEEDEVTLFCENVPTEILAEVLEEADDDIQLKLIKNLKTPFILQLFSLLPKDEVVDILGGLQFKQKKELLHAMKNEDSEILVTLLNYEKDSAGGKMTTEYIALRSNITVSEALVKIKQIGPKTEVIETLFIINTKRELVGQVDLRDILISSNNVLLEDIMDTQVISVYPETDQEEVSQLTSKYSLTVIPVVNRKQALLGIITIDDIIDVLQEEYTEDILQMGGVDKDETIGGTLLDSIKKRLPWLCVNLVTASIASSVVGLFDSTISEVVALAVVMPIIAGMGGNAGTQTLSIIIRNIALGEMEPEEYKGIFKKELTIGILHGLFIGTLIGSILFLIYGNIYLSLLALFSMLFNISLACSMGFLVPTTLKKLKLDPALSSGIFLTATTDTLGFFVFLGLATVFISYLT